MIKPLRRYHFFIWRALAWVLPFSFAAAIIVRPPASEIRDKGADAFTAELTVLNDSTALVTINVGRPLATPSCVVYYDLPENRTLLGKLDHQGQYQFRIERPAGTVRLNLLDVIHQKTIRSFSLTEH